jgi:hypothetical protein
MLISPMLFILSGSPLFVSRRFGTIDMAKSALSDRFPAAAPPVGCRGIPGRCKMIVTWS